MGLPKVFIDGNAGTTGMLIGERLAARTDIQLVTLEEARRKDEASRARCLNEAGIAILCLPDEEARHAVSMIENDNVRVIDASSAHRTTPEWIYGMPEWDAARPAQIAATKRLSNPGCYALGAICLLRPLIVSGLLSPEARVSFSAVSGYTGGGKSLVKHYEDGDAPPFQVYGLNLNHKHTEEIRLWSGLTKPPIFMPSVGNFPRGLLVQLPLMEDLDPQQVRDTLTEFYATSPRIKVMEEQPDDLSATALAKTDEIRLFVFGTRGRLLLVAQMDNLGAGAAGSAILNLNLMLGKHDE